MMVVTAAQMRRVEEYVAGLGMDALRLMENAGAQAARFLLRETDCKDKQAVLLCGRGNNGGDACVMARHLAAAGVFSRVTLLICAGQPATKQASIMFDRLHGTGVELVQVVFDKSTAFRRLAAADVIVDGLYGIGFHGDLNDLPAQLLEAANESSAVRLALDLPSGMNADSGVVVKGAFAPHHTLAFAAYKNAHLSDFSAKCGKITLLDIGIPTEAYFACGVDVIFTDKETVRRMVPKRPLDCHKGSFGRALVLCGSLSMNGAAFLSASGALRAGAGLVTLATPKSVVQGLMGRLVEATFLPMDETIDGFVSGADTNAFLRAAKGKNAILAGCGLGCGMGSAKLIDALLRQTKAPVVLDADGLNLAAVHKDEWKAHSCPLVLTPHAGEMARLTGETVPSSPDKRKAAALSLAKEWDAVVVLKGHETVICSPDGRCFFNRTGNPGLAKGGTGDLLAGLITGLLAQGLEPVEAAAVGVWLHGKAAELAVSQTGEAGMLASDLLPLIGKVWAELVR